MKVERYAVPLVSAAAFLVPGLALWLPSGYSIGAAMLLLVQKQERIELVFGDIHAENRFCHSNVFNGRCQTVGNSSRKPLL